MDAETNQARDETGQRTLTTIHRSETPKYEVSGSGSALQDSNQYTAGRRGERTRSRRTRALTKAQKKNVTRQPPQKERAREETGKPRYGGPRLIASVAKKGAEGTAPDETPGAQPQLLPNAHVDDTAENGTKLAFSAGRQTRALRFRQGRKTRQYCV